MLRQILEERVHLRMESAEGAGGTLLKQMLARQELGKTHDSPFIYRSAGSISM